MSDDTHGSRLRAVNATTALGGLIVLGLLLAELGFRLTSRQQQFVLVATQVALWLTIGAEALRIAMHPDRPRYIRRHPGEVVLAGLMLLVMAVQPWIRGALSELWPAVEPSRISVFVLGALQLIVLAVMTRRLLQWSQVVAFVRVSPRALLIGSYLGLILVGALLLMLPRATVAPGSLSWLDALFMSTSAVCVTGLAVIDPATAFTGFGHTLLLILIQLGGLGLMTFTYFFVSLFGGGITIRDRAILLDFLNEEHVGRITGSLMAIITMTFACEAAGALLLYAALGDAGGPLAWFHHVFHAVSAFCNAGFSLYSDGLYNPLTRSHGGYQLVIMSLIVIGGLGFPVLKNLWDHSRGRLLQPRVRAPRLTTHTRVVVVTTVALILGGAAVLLACEYLPRDQPLRAGHVLAALFTSVTTRTAGFNTVPIDGLLPATTMIVIVLMFIGGSPASTAGGIKTTTFAVALLNTLRILRNSTGDLVAYGRQIPARLANRAFAIALLAMGWVAASSITLMALMPQAAPLDLLFEAVSAFATVGLSRGVTPELPALGKLVIVASMIVGRIGILYFALGVLGKESRGRMRYPEESVIIS